MYARVIPRGLHPLPGRLTTIEIVTEHEGDLKQVLVALARSVSCRHMATALFEQLDMQPSTDLLLALQEEGKEKP